MLKHLPNILSFLRIAIAPALLLSLSENYLYFSFVLLSIGALTDFFDGYLARKLNSESKFGEILDPIADKIFSNAVLWGIYAYIGHSVPVLFLAATLSFRDIVLILGGIFVFVKKMQFSMAPVYISKICTCLIFLLSIIAIVCGTSNLYFSILSYLCLSIVFSTIFVYVSRFLKR